MLLFDLTPDLGASEGHASPADSGSIRIEITFKEALIKTIICLLYLEYNYGASIFIVLSQRDNSDVVYIKGREFISGCFSIRYATPF
jgi:hypothetical protein